MEARLVHVRKDAAKEGEQSEYYISKANQAGIPVSHDLYKELPGHCLNISEEAMNFLHDILGPKGAWNGWHLQAIGEVKRGQNGIFFDVVLALKSEAKPLLTPGTDYFEMVSPSDKTVSSPEKKISSSQSSTPCLKSMIPKDRLCYCTVIPRKSEAKPLSTLETDHFEIVSSPEKMVSSPENVSSSEKLVPLTVKQ